MSLTTLHCTGAAMALRYYLAAGTVAAGTGSRGYSPSPTGIPPPPFPLGGRPCIGLFLCTDMSCMCSLGLCARARSQQSMSRPWRVALHGVRDGNPTRRLPVPVPTMPRWVMRQALPCVAYHSSCKTVTSAPSTLDARTLL